MIPHALPSTRFRTPSTCKPQFISIPANLDLKLKKKILIMWLIRSAFSSHGALSHSAIVVFSNLMRMATQYLLPMIKGATSPLAFVSSPSEGMMHVRKYSGGSLGMGNLSLSQVACHEGSMRLKSVLRSPFSRKMCNTAHVMSPPSFKGMDSISASSMW